MGKYCLWESFELHRHHNKDWTIAFCWECCTLLSLLKIYGTRARICLLAKAKDMKSNKRFSPYLGTHDNKLNLTELNKMFSQNPSLDVSSFQFCLVQSGLEIVQSAETGPSARPPAIPRTFTLFYSRANFHIYTRPINL